ncbi:unnamed protein product [Ceratitis capitata]|uniref:(Mediterranean fruit fly) hypothetical protein n=1 Tax=Ceratitis capitata TaxID=7213 RepID=A0A811UX44_CERCA|nr:unnamed protein product [Ceratitis capitata]
MWSHNNGRHIVQTYPEVHNELGDLQSPRRTVSQPVGCSVASFSLTGSIGAERADGSASSCKRQTSPKYSNRIFTARAQKEYKAGERASDFVSELVHVCESGMEAPKGMQRHARYAAP